MDLQICQTKKKRIQMIETQTKTNDNKSRMQTYGRPTTNLLQHQQQYSRDRDLVAFISFLRFQKWKANIQIFFSNLVTLVLKYSKYSFGYITFEFHTTHCVDETDHNQCNMLDAYHQKLWSLNANFHVLSKFENIAQEFSTSVTFLCYGCFSCFPFFFSSFTKLLVSFDWRQSVI